jgi:hypothetical protein
MAVPKAQGGPEAIFRIFQGTNVEFDAGAEGTKRLQGVGFEGALGDRQDVVFDDGAEGTRRARDVVVLDREGAIARLGHWFRVIG